MKRFLHTLVFFGLYLTVRAQDPEITERILPVIKRIGETSEMDCVVIRQNDNKVYWIHKDSSTTISSDDSIEVDPKLNPILDGWPKYMIRRVKKGDKNTYTLIINRLEPRDAGTYTCKIIIRGSDRHPAKDGQLVVLVPPSIVPSMTTQAMTINEGDSFNLTCESTGHPRPNITWVRANGNPLPNGKLRHMSRWMEIENIKEKDRGVFRCLADNNVRPPTQYDITVTVQFKPTARAVQSSYGQAHSRNFDVVLECTIGGFPEPDLRWFRNNSAGVWEPITNNDKYVINILLNHANLLSPHERWFQLVIRTVQSNDYQDYICAGFNDYGMEFAKVQMYETSECQGPNCPEEQDPAKGRSSDIHSITTTLLTFTLIYWLFHSNDNV